MRNRSIALTAGFAVLIATTAKAGIIAQDDFQVPPYTVGALAGQAVGGTGFQGNWQGIVTSGLSITGNGVVGRPVNNGQNAGDTATFAGSGFSLSTGQLFVAYNIDNLRGATLFGTRLDLNTNLAFVSAEIGSAVGANFGILTRAGFGSTADAETNISTLGSHRVVGVFDFSNNSIAIFVDPTVGSFYNTNGTNNADATAAWTPPASYIATSYNLVENFSDQVNFGHVLFSDQFPAPSVAAVPEPSTIALAAIGSIAGLLGMARRRLIKSTQSV